MSRFRDRVLCAATLAALGAPAVLAADRPATPEGAQELRDLFARFLPTAATSLVTVNPEGAHYLISFDLSALNPLLEAAGAAVSYDPATLLYRAAEQDDGKWRVTMDSLPKILTRSEAATSTVDIANFNETLLIDPAIAWFVSGSASADRGLIKSQEKRNEATIDFGQFRADLSSKTIGGGAVSSKGTEEVADIAVKIAGPGEGTTPVNVSGRVDKAKIHVEVEGLKSRKAFELWELLAGHRARGDLAAHEAELKGLLKQLAAPGLSFGEGLEAQKAVIESQIGAVAASDLKYRIGAANAGPQSSVNLAVSLEGLSLPAGLAPPGATELTPSNVDLAATLKGIDFAAAANEAIAVMNLQGDDPPISDADSARVMAALLSAGPLRVEFAPSHVRAPAVDADFEGVIRYAPGKPTGSMTLRMRGFDKTMAAVKALGPEISGKALPGLAMAKGLAKSEPDGSLSWIVELGDDRSIKVNGLPLGKAPD
jgi:hypothetical protein